VVGIYDETVVESRVGEILPRLLAGVFASSWLTFPGFGLIDLSVTVAGYASWPILSKRDGDCT
jgi:hypothetical protein